MKCDFCKLENLNGKYCSECGNPLSNPPASCANCGNPKLLGKFCHECGYQTQGITACPSCHAPDQTGKFCKVCGYLISGQEHNQSQDEKQHEFLVEGEFDRGHVRCKACGGLSARYRLPGVKVEYCTICSSGSTYLSF